MEFRRILQRQHPKRAYPQPKHLQANIARVNIKTLQLGDDNIGVHVSMSGSRSVTSDSGSPVTVTFGNQTVGDVLTVDMRVYVMQTLSSANVVCDIFVDPALKLNLNTSTGTGQISKQIQKREI